MAMRPQTIDDDSTSPPSARAPHTSNFSNPQQSSGMSLEDQVGLLTARLINVETRLRTLTDETYNSFFAVKEDITDARQQATRQISSANDTLHRQAASDKEHHQAEISSVNKRLDDIGPMLNSVDIQEGQNSASIQGLADRLKDYVWRTDRDIDEMEEEFREVYREVDRLGYKVSSLHRPIIKVDDDQIMIDLKPGSSARGVSTRSDDQKTQDKNRTTIRMINPSRMYQSNERTERSDIAQPRTTRSTVKEEYWSRPSRSVQTANLVSTY